MYLFISHAYHRISNRIYRGFKRKCSDKLKSVKNNAKKIVIIILSSESGKLDEMQI